MRRPGRSATEKVAASFAAPHQNPRETAYAWHMLDTHLTLVSGMRAIEASLQTRLSRICCDYSLTWAPAWGQTGCQVDETPPADFKLAVRSSRASVAAVLTRHQVEACAAGVCHPDVISLTLECVVVVRDA